MSWSLASRAERDRAGVRRAILRVALVAGVLALGLFAFLVYVLLAQGDAVYWEGEIAEFERHDISNPPPEGAVVFVGGGTVRHWPDLAAQMSPIPIVNRGFGGAYAEHVAVFAPRIVTPYDPAGVVVAAGGDDLADVGGKSPESVVADLEKVVDIVRGDGGVDAPQVYLLAIMPAPMRAARWANAKAANDLIRDLAAARKGVTFVDVASPLFDAAGNIRNDYFRWDGLTLNEEGYAVIGRLVRQQLMADLGARYRRTPPAPRDGPETSLPPAP